MHFYLNSQKLINPIIIIANFEKEIDSAGIFEKILEQIRKWYIKDCEVSLPENICEIDKEIINYFNYIHEKGEYVIALIDYKIIMYNNSIDYKLLDYLFSFKTKYPSLNLFFFTGNLEDDCFSGVIKIEPEMDEMLEKDILYTYRRIKKHINTG